MAWQHSVTGSHRIAAAFLFYTGATRLDLGRRGVAARCRGRPDGQRRVAVFGAVLIWWVVGRLPRYRALPPPPSLPPPPPGGARDARLHA